MELVAGALAEWPAATGSTLGVVTKVDGPRVTVRFDGERESRLFNARAGVIRRVALQGMVQRPSTGEVGMIQREAAASPPKWQVMLLDGRVLTIAEADLRPHVLDDPYSRLADGRLGSARQFALALTARRFELEHLNNELVSLGEARVAIKPHQVSVVHRVITNYPHRFLLCDEVGLGKTIEAGLVVKELRARGGAERVLVIAPPNLVRQWQFELKSKFNESFSLLNSDTIKYLRSQGTDGNPFRAFDSVIVSSAWITGAEWARLAAEVDWDMVIVDEAHHARVRWSGSRRTETNLYKVVRSLAAPDAFSKRAALFLTATPMQLDSGELYSLVELLDPALFPTVEHFERHRDEVPGLSRLVHDLSEHGFPIPDRDPSEVAQRVAGFLAMDEADALARLMGGHESVALLCEDLSARHLLSEVLVRNRKKLVGGFMPRHAHRWEVELTVQEQRALDAVEDYVREGYALADRTSDVAFGFVMVIFQKLMASSIRALRMSLDRRRQRLEDQVERPTLTKKAKARVAAIEDEIDRDAYASVLLDELAVGNSSEADELRSLVDLLDQVPIDSKAETLLQQLQALAAIDGSAKVLLFTEFRETQEYLRERIGAIGWEVHLFHGQMKPDAKDGSVEAFRLTSRPSILLSTEAGGEGRNFQFCHLLVNYDLPWNPMRIEQRIGRVDRIGQEHTVQVFNFWVKGTIEERVLDVLENRINIFEDTVGGLDPILGDAERDLKKIFQLGGEDRDRALAAYETQLERRLAVARAAEEKLRDFIMETKSYSREIAEQLATQASPITPADQQRFVSALLTDVRTHLREQPDGTFEVMFHEPFVSEFPDHVKGGLQRRTIAMRPDVKQDSQHVEYFALGHPVVDDLLHRVTSPTYAGSASAVEIDATAALGPASGWLVVYEIGVPAVREVRELTAYFIVDDGSVDRELGAALLVRASEFPSDRSIPASDVEVDSLDGALTEAEGLASDRLDDLERRAHDESARQVDREKAKIAAYYDYRDQAAADRLASSRAVLNRLEAATDDDVRRAIPMWRANSARDAELVEGLRGERVNRLNQLEHQVTGGGDYRLVAAARVVIVPGPTEGG